MYAAIDRRVRLTSNLTSSYVIHYPILLTILSSPPQSVLMAHGPTSNSFCTPWVNLFSPGSFHL